MYIDCCKEQQQDTAKGAQVDRSQGAWLDIDIHILHLRPVKQPNHHAHFTPFSGIPNHGFDFVSDASVWLCKCVSSFSPSRRSSCLRPMKAMLVPKEGDSYAPRNLFTALDIRFAKEANQLTI